MERGEKKKYELESRTGTSAEILVSRIQSKNRVLIVRRLLAGSSSDLEHISETISRNCDVLQTDI